MNPHRHDSIAPTRFARLLLAVCFGAGLAVVAQSAPARGEHRTEELPEGLLARLKSSMPQAGTPRAGAQPAAPQQGSLLFNSFK